MKIDPQIAPNFCGPKAAAPLNLSNTFIFVTTFGEDLHQVAKAKRCYMAAAIILPKHPPLITNDPDCEVFLIFFLIGSRLPSSFLRRERQE